MKWESACGFCGRIWDGDRCNVVLYEGRIVGVSTFRYQRGWPNDLLMWRAIEPSSRDHTLLRSHAAREIVAAVRVWRVLPPRARRVLEGALRRPGEAE